MVNEQGLQDVIYPQENYASVTPEFDTPVDE